MFRPAVPLYAVLVFDSAMRDGAAPHTVRFP
jgi:hypothetical protein